MAGPWEAYVWWVWTHLCDQLRHGGMSGEVLGPDRAAWIRTIEFLVPEHRRREVYLAVSREIWPLFRDDLRERSLLLEEWASGRKDRDTNTGKKRTRRGDARAFSKWIAEAHRAAGAGRPEVGPGSPPPPPDPDGPLEGVDALVGYRRPTQPPMPRMVNDIRGRGRIAQILFAQPGSPERRGEKEGIGRSPREPLRDPE